MSGAAVFIVRFRGGSIAAVYNNAPAAEKHVGALPLAQRPGARVERWTAHTDPLPKAEGAAS